MITLVIATALAVAGVAATAFALPRDGYRRTPTDWTRLP
ncbi:hypothetical protein HD594_000763 [Microbacterium thalassium]|uniref:Uncharacterized protein n=1 Tax=Microbacterium thalassium TaxID=362649 RepID=A0A7X0KTT0_9MICO|nr:hypothetical protein [Microbacterium thalassium]